MTNKDYYSILGVDRDADEAAIKNAFKKLALKYHPDRHINDSEEEQKLAEEKMKEANEAYTVLSDAKKRQEYDLYGTVGENIGSNGYYGGGFGDIDDIFEQVRNMHGYGSGWFRGNGNNQHVKGSDIRISVEITLEELYDRKPKTYKYKRKVACPDCNGTGSSDKKTHKCPHCNGNGYIETVQRYGNSTLVQKTICPYCGGSGVSNITNPCKHCNGTGIEDGEHTVTIEIPNGVVNGSTIRLPNLGNMGQNGTQPGSLIVQFIIKQHPVFIIGNNGRDLCCKTNVSVLDCITGCEKEVTCIDGSKVKIKVPQGAHENTKISVRGKGLYGGDMIIYIVHEMPNDLNREEKKYIDALKKCKHFKK